MPLPARFDSLRAALTESGLAQAVLSHPETLASLGCFETPVEDWPVSNPFVALPALLCLGTDDAVLVCADFHIPDVRADDIADGHVPVVRLPNERPTRQASCARPSSPRSTRRGSALGRPASRQVTCRTRSRTGFERGRARTRGVRRGRDDVTARGPYRAISVAIRAACRLADVVQQAVKDHAAPGSARPSWRDWPPAAMNREAGRRVPAILTVTTGAEATATGGGVATARVVEASDLVLTDTSPWIDGAWSDTANAVFVGTPDRETRRRFDAVRRALHDGIALCRPGAVAKDVDRKVRELLAEHGPTYPHHTGHGIGAAWSEEPRITPYNEMRIEEGMVLALEPAIYLPGWGGIRLEHVFARRCDRQRDPDAIRAHAVRAP